MAAAWAVCGGGDVWYVCKHQRPHGGHEVLLPAVFTSARQVGEVLRTSAGASDVTVSATLPQGHGTLMLALETGAAVTFVSTCRVDFFRRKVRGKSVWSAGS